MHGIKIGQDTLIGGSSFVNKDIGAIISYGVPSKTIRTRKKDEKYL